MILVKLINEGRVVKQISSRVHEAVVLEQLKKYNGPVDEIIYEGELSEGAKEILQRVAKRVIPAAMAAGLALGNANSAQAQNHFPGTNQSIGQHIADIFSPNYREIQRQRRAERDTRRAEQDAYHKEIRKARVGQARQQGRQDSRAYSGSEMPNGTKVYDQARLSGDGRSIILYDLDHRVTRIDRAGSEFIPADSQRLAHYITRNGQVYYVRHAANMMSREGVEGIVEDPTVGTIPANGGGVSGSTIKPTGTKGPTPNTPNKTTTQPADDEQAGLELDKDHGLDKQTLDAIKKAGIAVDIKEKNSNRLEQRIRGVTEGVESTTSNLDAVFNEHDFYRLEHIWPALEAGDKQEALRQINHYLRKGKNRAWWGDLQALDIEIDANDVENSQVTWSKPLNQDVTEGFTDPKLQAILDKHESSWQAFKAGGDLTDNEEFYDDLFGYFSNSGEMPYGVAKARDGDPVNWITKALDRLAGNEEIGEMNNKLSEAYIKSPKDAIDVLANLRQIGKSIERGQGQYQGNLANEYANDVWSVYSWLENRANVNDSKLKAILDPIFDLRKKAKSMEMKPGSGADAQFGNEIVNRLYPLMQWIEMNVKVSESSDDLDPDAASPADQASADKNIIMQIRKAADYEKPTKLNLDDGTQFVIDSPAATKILGMFDKLKPDSKLLMQQVLNKQDGIRQILGHLGESLEEDVTLVEAEQYNSLNDVYPSGSTEIWYWKEDFARDAMMGAAFMKKQGVMPTPETVPDNYVLIGKVAETNPDKIFHMMQGEIWSPEGQANKMIRASGTGHTSMSVGDIVRVGGKWLMVDRYGFQDLAKEVQDESLQLESTYFDAKKTAALIANRIISETYYK